MALNHPELFVGLLIAFIILMIWLLPKIWRGVKALARAIARLFGGAPEPAAESAASGAGASRSSGATPEIALSLPAGSDDKYKS